MTDITTTIAIAESGPCRATGCTEQGPFEPWWNYPQGGFKRLCPRHYAELKELWRLEHNRLHPNFQLPPRAEVP